MTITNIVEGHAALLRYMMESPKHLPKDVKEILIDLLATSGGSTSNILISVVELAYARRTDLPPEFLAICTQLALIFDTQFPTYVDTYRGEALATEFKKIKGVSLLLPKPKTHKHKTPEVREDLLPPAAVQDREEAPAS